MTIRGRWAELITETEATHLSELRQRGMEVRRIEIDCLSAIDRAACPHCTTFIHTDLPRAGFGLVVCPTCENTVGLMRVLADGARHEWLSIPWDT